MVFRLLLFVVICGVVKSQIPKYMLSSSSLYAPKRSSGSISSISSGKYGMPGAATNPSIVAIPLYVRNGGANKNPYDMLSSGLERRVPSASNRYSQYAAILPKKSLESISRYEKPVAYSSYSKYDSPKTSSSSYEPVRYEISKSSEPGYGDASSVSLLSSGYGGSGAVSVAYPPSNYKSSSQASSPVPRLKAVDYDDNQKAALADFASALENFELKSIRNEDIYDLPPINPGQAFSAPRILPKKQQQEARVTEEPSYAPSSYNKAQTYEAPVRSSQSYDAPVRSSQSYDAPARSLQSYDAPVRSSQSYDTPSRGSSAYSQSSGQTYDDRSYSPSSPSYSSAGSPQSYASSDYASNTERPSEGYRSEYRGEERREQAYRPASDSYRSVDSYRGSDYSSQPSYGAGSSSYDAPQDAYPTRSGSYGAASGEYYAPAASRPDDPNCPYKDQAAASEYSAPATVSSAYAGSSKLTSAKESGYASLASIGSQGQGYDSEEPLDPSKLDLKIVHLPVSVLKRLVGNGELALPSFQKKKK